MAGKKGCSGTHNNHNPTGPKRTELQRQLDRYELIRMLREGYTKSAAAMELGLSAGQISQDWKVAIKELTEHTEENFQQLVAIKLEEYGHAKVESWKAYHQSKKELKPVYKPDKNGKLQLEFVETPREPNPAHARIVIDCLKAECELRGLVAEKKVSIRGTVNHGINWEVLAGAIPPEGQPMPDEVEALIESALQRSMTVETTATHAPEELEHREVEGVE